MKPKVVLLQSKSLTEKIFAEKQLERLRTVANVVVNNERSNPTEKEAAQLLAGADACITSWGCPRMTEEMLDSAPDLRLIVHAAGTVKGVVSEAVWTRGITVTSGAPALAVGVAETTLGLTITSLKNIWELAQVTREGRWRGPEAEKVRELYEVTIGVVGASHVGRHFIKLLQNFEVEILVYDPVRTAAEIQELGAKKVELEQLLRRSDVVSVHAPSIPETHHMFRRETFKLMKDDAIFINTARGSLVNEDDLIAELRQGRFWACIDVTDPEPPAASSPLRSLPNVTLIPHIAGVVTNGHLRIGRYAVDEIVRFSAGKEPINPVTEDALATLA